MKLPSKNIMSLVIALALGAATLILVNVYLAKEKSRLAVEKEQQLGKEVAVVVANQDIARGTQITQAMVKIAGVRETNLQPRAVSSLDSAVGKVAIADMVSGEQVSLTKLMSASSAVSEAPKSRGSFVSGLAGSIPAGKRSFTIAIDEVSAAGGMIKPNDYVDIMGIFPFTQQIESKTISQNVSVTLFQNVLVLATGKEVASRNQEAEGPRTGGGGGGTITFALTPQQVELLNFAQDFGRLKLILRPPLETSITLLPPVTADVLWQQIITQAGMQLPQKEAQGEATPEKKAATVEIYRGNAKEVRPLE